jgi:hypothetical protein
MRYILLCFAAILCETAHAYEVSNHSDISVAAFSISKLRDTTANGKLFRLGLRSLDLESDRQFFPRATGTALAPDAVNCWPLGSDNKRAIPADFNKLTLAQLIRYGACYEDNVENGAFRVFAHFYNPQAGGVGLSVPGSGTAQPASPEWSLTGAGATSGIILATGPNHFSYADARASFYRALTQTRKAERDTNWGLTFQSPGHVIHHLQDMAQPQHVRGDDHCDAAPCALSLSYKPSAFERLMGTQRFVEAIQSLAQSATTPILFGSPREFWNAAGSETLSAYAAANQGIAAYTNTNFVSTRTDFRLKWYHGATKPESRISDSHTRCNRDHQYRSSHRLHQRKFASKAFDTVSGPFEMHCEFLGDDGTTKYAQVVRFDF